VNVALDDLLTADRALVEAVAASDAKAAGLPLDAEFTWIDAHGRAGTSIGEPLLGSEKKLSPIVHRYEHAASVVAERGKLFVMRLWIKRADGWRCIVWHEVSQELPAPPHGQGRRDHDNPARVIPYEPRDAHERDALASWQRLEQAVIEHDAETWANHVADEFLVLGPTRRHTKSDRKAVLEDQKRKDTPSAPSPLVWAKLHGVKDAIVMRCQHQPFHGKAAQVSRLFIKRDGHWLMSASAQTTEQDAAIKTID
jgi:hypothetical protein